VAANPLAHRRGSAVAALSHSGAPGHTAPRADAARLAPGRPLPPLAGRRGARAGRRGDAGGARPARI